MVRILLITFLMLFNLLPTPADEQIKETLKIDGKVEYDDNMVETIYLEEDVEKPQLNIPQHSLTLPVGVLNITSNTNTQRSALARAMVSRNSLGDIIPLNDSISASLGGLSYGTTWGEEISYSQLEATTSMFVRYDFPKYFSFITSFRQSANRDMEGQYSSVRVIPEWHITDKLTLKTAFTDYVQKAKNKTELTIVYTPSLKKYADSLKFELGVAQTFYTNGNTSQAVNFSTGFKL